MKLHSNTEVIFGPPGTGKTTKLIERVLENCDDYSPSDVCYLAFTNNAADVARDRLRKASNKVFKYVKTIHSFCYANTPCRRVMLTGRDMFDLGKILGYRLVPPNIKNPEVSLKFQKGWKMQMIYESVRAGMSVKDAIHKVSAAITVADVEDFFLKYNKFKEDRNLIDFNDMLIDFVNTGSCPKFRMLVVDEAQDLSAMQWLVIKKIAENTSDKVIVAGDDDQAIFVWAGADPVAMLNIEGTQTVLGQSYRVPKTVMPLANKIVGRIKKRKDKEWKPTDHDGLLHRQATLSTIDMSYNTGSWLLLARNRLYLELYHQILRQRNYIYDSVIEPPIPQNIYGAIATWNKLLTNQKVSNYSVAAMLKLIPSEFFTFTRKMQTVEDVLDSGEFIDRLYIHDRYGLDIVGSWDQMLDIKPRYRQYIVDALMAGEVLSKTPRIMVSTIHQAKGAEADNVILLDCMSNNTKMGSDASDEEHRVWYVGVTRTKNRLYIVDDYGTERYDF